MAIIMDVIKTTLAGKTSNIGNIGEFYVFLECADQSGPKMGQNMV